VLKINNTLASDKKIMINVSSNKRKKVIKKMLQNYELYLFILPALIYFITFHYAPMYGIIIAFKNYIPTKGFWGSPWAGFRHFTNFFNSYYFWLLLKNTVGIAFYSLIAGFPIPIILALALNEVQNKHFKKIVQNVTYAPHFISTVVMVGMLISFLSPSSGVVNQFIQFLGFEPINFLGKENMFKDIYVWSGIWQGMGWGSIVYLGALSGIDPQLHEAGIVDGATRFQRIIHINIPSIMPTMVILLILNLGSIMNVGFEKIFLMQNPLVMDASEVISTYVYRMGLQKAQYSFSAAVGLFNSLINFTLLITVNSIAKKLNETSLW
jgi:putative aldouronate transport system permease protein